MICKMMKKGLHSSGEYNAMTNDYWKQTVQISCSMYSSSRATSS